MTLTNARKAIVTFVGTLVTNAVADLMQDGHPFPTNWGDAARWLLSVTILTASVYTVKPGKDIVTPTAPPNPYAPDGGNVPVQPAPPPPSQPGTPDRPFG